tara:strand:+ start:34404 stop:35831 length:1428 start_codon:yes stop_codon:yes gene_type:complete
MNCSTNFLRYTIFSAVALSVFSVIVDAAPKSKPNIIVIYSDDHGWADLGAQGVNSDIRTPNLDKLAADGVRFSHGYVSAPQCVPSRAGLMTGRYQQRFDMEANGSRALPLEELTLAERLKDAGYISCQVGKWHLENREKNKRRGNDLAEKQPEYSSEPKDHGFGEYYNGSMNTINASHDLQGNKLSDGNNTIKDSRFRCVWQSDAAMQFIKRHTKDPFFLYLAYFTPHVPLESPEPWFSKTPAHLPLERRQALAMIAAMDEGIGNIRELLRKEGLEETTLIFFIGDNGAPLKKGAWDGSVNLPLVGEKGMLTDGGVRTPFVAAWPGKLPAGKVYDPAVSSLDVAATAVAIAGLPNDRNLDGVNILPFVKGEKTGVPHDILYWRWRSQASVLSGKYKLILLGKDEKYLFDTTTPEGETKNLITQYPKIAVDLEGKLMEWNATLPPPGLPRPVVNQDQLFFDAHVKMNGTKVEKPKE